MAKIDFVHPATKHLPAFTATVEVRVWGVAGNEQQPFYIGSGLNFQANANYWLEILYTVEGAQIFYTRNFLHHHSHTSWGIPSPDSRLDELVKVGEGRFGFGDVLPETSLTLILKKFSYEDENGEDKQGTHCRLEISTDAGAVFGRSTPGESEVNINLNGIDLEEGVRFMRELVREIDTADQGKHPNPAGFTPGSSKWPFFEQLNRQAYDKISEDYQESYFENSILVETFDHWLEKITPGGRILDAGCGHGDPIIRHLLDKGFQVTGSDFSPAMLQRARNQFPQVNFIQKATTEIDDQAAFDGICSFSSLLYLDLIDFLQSIYRLHIALKPGGLLFLFGLDSGPDWRGEPFGFRVGQWMWSWHYGMEEAASLLEEHGYFEVLETWKVRVDEGEAERIEKELEKQKQDEEEYYRRQKENPNPLPIPLPFLKMPVERSPYAYVIIARRTSIKY